jgi:chromosome segregation ATPase
MDEMQNLRKTHQKELNDFGRSLENLTNENNHLTLTNTTLGNTISKFTAENALKENILNKYKTDLNEINNTTEKNFRMCSERVNELILEYNRDRQSWESEKINLLMKIENIENDCFLYKTQIEDYEKNKIINGNNLKKLILKYIDDNFRERFKI